MAGISSLGVGSGLDLAALVDNLLAAERAPAENRLNAKQARAQTKLSAFGTLKSAVDALATSVKKLSSFETSMKATSADPDALAVTVGDNPSPGTYRIVVRELASAQSLASQTFDDTDAPLGEGTLTLTVGETVTEIQLGEETNSLAAIRDAINASDTGANAVIVRDGDAYRLLLTSAESGLDNQMTLTVDGTVDGRLASAQMTQTAAAKDASFSVNGLELSASGNTVDDVIPGLTLDLKRAGEDPVTVTVELDRGGARKALEDLVGKYNALVDRVRSLGRYDAAAGQGAALSGDSTLRSVESTLAGVFSTTYGEAGAPFSSLLDIGLHTDASGKAVLDAEAFEAALASDEAGVEALVSSFATAFGATLDSYVESDGLLEARTDGLNAELKRIGEQRDALARRMEQVEVRLRAQFTALDSMLAQFQSTSSYLASQLAGLSNLKL